MSASDAVTIRTPRGGPDRRRLREPRKTTPYRSGARSVLQARPGGWRGRRRRGWRGWGRVVLFQAAGTVTAGEPTLFDSDDRDGGEDEQQPRAGSVPVHAGHPRLAGAQLPGG